MTLTELRDRIAAATYEFGDPLLDIALAKMAGWTCVQFGAPEWRPPGKYAGQPNPPRFTASIDAAVTLLPQDDGLFWQVGNDGEGQNPADFRAVVMLGGTIYAPTFDATAATPALALCLARVEYEISKAGK